MKILKKVPGFRSGKKANKITASVYYIFFLLMLVTEVPKTDSVATALMFLVCPFFIFNTINVVKNKEGVFSKKGLKKVVAPFVFILGTLLLLGEPTPNTNINTLEYSANTKQEITQEIPVINTEDESKKDEENSLLEENKEISESEIHFINTGNSDAILIKQSNEFALIDAGDNNDEESIVEYLKKNNVKSLKYVFSTHGDADHCGGLDAVLDSFDVENVFVANGDVNTKTYTDFINSVANKGLTPSVPLLGSKFNLGTATFEVLSVANTNDRNNNSIVLLYTNGEDKILLTGDADTDILKNIDVSDVDLLKVGHHGSRTSTDEAFLNKLGESVKYGVILVGKDNKYSHPHKETMDALKNHNIEVHRSDECGDIVFISTGKGLKVDCKKGSYNAGDNSSASKENDTVTNNVSASNKDNSSSSNTTSSNSSSTHGSSNNSVSNNTVSSNNSSSSTTNKVEVESNNAPSTESSDSKTVYWTSGGKKYHFSSSCSRMKNPMSGTISQSGRTPCSKCAY